MPPKKAAAKTEAAQPTRASKRTRAPAASTEVAATVSESDEEEQPKKKAKASASTKKAPAAASTSKKASAASTKKSTKKAAAAALADEEDEEAEEDAADEDDAEEDEAPAGSGLGTLKEATDLLAALNASVRPDRVQVAFMTDKVALLTAMESGATYDKSHVLLIDPATLAAKALPQQMKAWGIKSSGARTELIRRWKTFIAQDGHLAKKKPKKRALDSFTGGRAEAKDPYYIRKAAYQAIWNSM